MSFPRTLLSLYRGRVGKILALVAVAISAVLAPSVLTSALQQYLLVLTVIYAVMALSLAIIMGQTGQWSFGHQAFLGIGAYASALSALRLHLPVVVAFGVAMLLSGLLGLVLGYIALRRTRGVYLAIVTVAFAEVAHLLAANWYQVTGGPLGLLNIPFPNIVLPLIGEIRFTTDSANYYLGLGILCVVAFFVARLADSKTGIALRALRNNEPLAQAVGISPLYHYVLGFAFGSAIAGLSGAMLVHYLGAISPALMTFDYLFAMLTMVILGGMSRIGGPILGAAIYVWVPQLLGVSDEVKVFLFSLLVAIALPLIPQGLYPALLGLLRLEWGRFTPRILSPAQVRVGPDHVDRKAG